MISRCLLPAALAIGMLSAASDAQAFNLFGRCGGCCDAAPSCGCDTCCAPACGCDTCDSCCDSCCDPCCKKKCGFLARMRAKRAAKKCCKASCCEPACGCDSCCDSCAPGVWLRQQLLLVLRTGLRLRHVLRAVLRALLQEEVWLPGPHASQARRQEVLQVQLL